MKRILSALLILCLFVTALPLSAIAEEQTYLVVTRDNAPIRTKASEDASVVHRCSKGEILESTGSTLNWYLNQWYKVRYNGKTCYIYSGNVKTHSHNYVKYSYQGANYAVCPDCGHATVIRSVNAKVSQSNAMAIAGYASMGLTSSAMDGPLPIGDMFGLLIVGIGTLYTVTTPSKSTVMELTEDLVDYFKDQPRICNDDSFYQVTRHSTGLSKTTGQCLNAAEAYALVRSGVDVWTLKRDTAEELASIYGPHYSEIDKDKPGYYHHFHLGADVTHKVKSAGHIFYDTSAEYHQTPN